MAYDAEIRVKTKIDNSEVVKLEADLEATEKKAEETGKALDQVTLNKDTADTAQHAAAGMESLADKTRKAASEAQNLDDAFKNTKIHLADGTTFDWNGNVIEEAVQDTAELNQEQTRLSDVAEKAAESMRTIAEETRKANDAANGLGESPATGMEKQLKPAQNMLAFIKQSFQDIPILFAGIANKSTAKIQQMEEEWDNLSDKAAHYRGVLQELESRGLGFGNQEYDDAYVEWQKAEQAVKEYKAQLVGAKAQQKDLSTGLKNVGEEGKKAFNKMNTGARKTKSMFGTMASRMKGLLLSLLIFNWISKGFNAMVAGMKKGFENLMKYSGNYANSVQSLKNAQATLGNSFAAAFAPIVQTVIPWLVQLINTISRAMTYVAQFIAILGGKSTFTRAKQVQDAYNKSLSGTAGAAKKAAGALAKFDDLDVLQKQDSSGGGENAADMFENVPVDPKVKGWLDGIRDKLKPILDYMKELKNAFIDGFWDGLGDPSGRLETIKKGLEQIKEALLDIWNDPAVRSAADAWAKSLLYMFGSLVGSIASIGLTIAAAFVGGLGEYLENNTGRIKDFLVSVFNIGTEINNLLSELFQSIAYIFEAFASESGIRFVSALIGVFADAGMGLLEVALKLGRDILNMLIQPIVENQEGFRTALEGLLSGAATILEGLKTSIDSIFDNLNAVYDAHFKPFFDSIAAGLTSIVNTILTVWNGNIQPIIDRISQKISELLTQYITPFVNNVVEFIGQIATHLQNFWELFLQPLVEWFISFAVPILSEAISLIIEVIIKVVEEIMAVLNGLMEFINDTVMPAWNGFWESAGDMFDAFWQAIKAIGDLIKDMFVGIIDVIRKLIDKDWKGAWDSAKKIFTTFKDNVKSIIDSIREFFQKFLDWIGEKIEWVLNKVQGIKDFFGGGGGGSSTGDGGYARTAVYRTAVSPVLADVPKLATGAVLRGGNPFLAWINDQGPGHTNIEAPLDTIRQGLREELSALGFGSGGQTKIVLQINGQDVGEAIVEDMLSVMNRKGYDVEVLGV
jgi:phage-related protein